MSTDTSQAAQDGSGSTITLPKPPDSQDSIPKQPKPYGFQKGISGNPGGRPKKTALVNPLDTFQAKPLEKKVDDLKERAALIAYHTSDDILQQASRPGKKDTVGLQRQMMVFGTAFDKVAANIEPEGIKVSLPKDAYQHFSQVVIALKSNNHPSVHSVDSVKTVELSENQNQKLSNTAPVAEIASR